MSEGLISVANGHVTFGEAVSRVADSLSPLGAAARIIAQSCALAVDLRELTLESHRIDNSQEVKLTELADRRAASSSTLREMRTQSGDVAVTSQGLREALACAQRQMVKPGLPFQERVLYKETV